jgi:hypothetical protein
VKHSVSSTGVWAELICKFSCIRSSKAMSLVQSQTQKHVSLLLIFLNITVLILLLVQFMFVCLDFSRKTVDYVGTVFNKYGGYCFMN